MVGALVCWKLVLLGFFCLGATGGVLLSNVTYQLIADAVGNSTDAFHYGIIIGFAIVCGSLTVCLASRLIKFLTAFSGAYMLVGSVDHFGVKFGWWQSASYDPLNGEIIRSLRSNSYLVAVFIVCKRLRTKRFSFFLCMCILHQSDLHSEDAYYPHTKQTCLCAVYLSS